MLRTTLYRCSEVLELYLKAKTYFHNYSSLPTWLKNSPHWKAGFSITLRYIGIPLEAVSSTEVKGASYKQYEVLCKRIQVLSKEYDILTSN